MLTSIFTIVLLFFLWLRFGQTEIKTLFSEILEIETLGANDLTFSSYNTLGQKFAETSNNNQTTTVIKITHLPEGMYYLTNNQSSTQPLKFLKTF